MATEPDEYAPILPGPGESDYERYLRTDELLALQKGADEWVHRDELLFQTVHQSSELWLKHAWVEAEEATRLVEARDLAAANRLLRRACLALKYVEGFLEHLELMSPWEYQEVRRVLGHGSGFDSPGFRAIRRVSPPHSASFAAPRSACSSSPASSTCSSRCRPGSTSPCAACSATAAASTRPASARCTA
jgi:tryptophan 2,3-dioxygenase